MEQTNGSKISVIIPIYNVEPYLRQCLDSVVNQTYRNLEIILVDDGSQDNCGMICDEYAQRDSRIVVIHKENGGLCAARNDGIARATGEWITFVDSDDWCELDYYEQLLKALDDQDVDVFCAGGHYSEYNGRPIANYTIKEAILCSHREELNRNMAKVLAPSYGDTNYSLAAPWDKLYRTSFIRENNIQFDTSSKAWEDIWFNFQIFDKAKTVGGCPHIGYNYRRVVTSITKSFNPYKPEINYDFISKLYAYMEKRDASDQIQQALAVRSIIVFSNALRVCWFHPQNIKPYKEKAKKIKEMKAWPYFHESIYSNNNLFFQKKFLVLKYFLRFPWIWPLKLMYGLNRRCLN